MSKRLGSLVMLCIASGIVGTADAQAPLTRARIGVMGGVNLATLGGEDADDLKNRVGLLGGLSYVRNWGGNVGMEMDILYSAKGAKSVDGNEELTIKVNYLEVPLLLRYDLPVTGTVRPHLAAGPSFAFRTGCGGEFSSGGASESIDCDEFQEGLDVKLKSFDLGATVGGGLDFAVGTKTFTVGARYTLGLTSVVEDDDSKNRAISLFAGISVPLRR